MNHPPKYACNYAVLRFRPYPETGEFVNLGVVVHCPEARRLDLQLERRRVARVTGFFPELDERAFRNARRAIRAEIERVQRLINEERDGELARRLFRELVRPRETVFRFGETRTILTNEPKLLADKLFGEYVHRQFAQKKEYQEKVMAHRYFEALKKLRPNQLFRLNQVVGTDEYHVRVPICSELRNAVGTPRRAIKPLDLAREEPTAIIEYGDTWIQRVRRLDAVGRLPERMIFAVRLPEDGTRLDAANKIITELKSTRVTLADSEAVEDVIHLAAD